MYNDVESTLRLGVNAMKDLSLWDKILYSLRYSDSLFHNVFLTIVIILVAVFLVSLFFIIKNKAYRQSRFSIILVTGFWMIVFPLGLFFLINISLADASNALAMNNAILYESNGKPTASFIVNKFVANESDNGMTSSSTFYKIQGIDLESGKILFDKKIKEIKGSVSQPKILCTSRDNLFLLFNNKILVLEKNSGKTIQSIKSVPDFDDVLLTPDPEMCKYDKSTQSIIFKATNGLFYSLDIEKLDILKNKSTDIEKLFENNHEPSIKRLSKGISICKTLEKSFYMFLTDSDMENIKEGKEISSSSYNTERRYLYKGNLESLNTLKKVCTDVFLSGGLLYNEISNDNSFYNEINSQDKNFLSYANISTRGESRAIAPFKVDGSDLTFIVHKKSIENGANVLLTAMDTKEEKKRWTIDTSASEINGCYRIDKDHILLLCQRKFEAMGSNTSTSFILYISLVDGKSTGHGFKYGISFEIGP